MNECKKCGNKIKKSDLFCSKCGSKVEKKKPQAKKEKTKPAPKSLKKDKTELSEDAKKRLKDELEVSIKAFKRGEISLDEFQSIKKGIVAKARAGVYDKDSVELKEEPPVEEKKYIVSETQKISIPDPIFSEDFDRPPIKGDEPKYSKLWFIAPIIFNIFGGIVAYFAIKNDDPKDAKKMLIIGVISFLIVGTGLGYYLVTSGFLSSDNGVETPTGIIIEGTDNKPAGDESDSTSNQSVSNKSAEEINLGLDDFEEGFILNELLTGTISNPLVYAKGDSAISDELKNRSWKENHKSVMSKPFVDLSRNETVVAIMIDSSVSKYDIKNDTYFDEKLSEFESKLIEEGFDLIDFDFNESGIMGMRPESHPIYESETFFEVFFYKKDTLVTLSVATVGRELDEIQIMTYAKLIEQRVE
jgi:hypothetical protein